MKTKKSLPLTMALASAVLTTTASAQLISVDIDAGKTPSTFSGAAVLGSAGDVWNAAVSPGSADDSFRSTGWQVDNLNWVDGTTASTVSFNITFSAPDRAKKGGLGWNSKAAFIPSSVYDLRRDYLFINHGDVGLNQSGMEAYYTIRLTGLSVETEYKLVLYAGGDNPGQGATFSNFSSSVTLLNGISSAYVPESPSTQKVDPVLGEDYIVVEFTTGSDQTSLSFRAESDGTSLFTTLSGFQLQVISEPVMLGSISVSW